MLKEEKILVSIIVPIYNSEKCLKRLVDSVLAQSYKNIELILVNDGSTDKSLEICNEYAKKDNRIKLYNQENSGVSITRNNGIKYSKGKYLMFIDSDDYIEKDMIFDMVSKIKSENVDLVISGININYFKNGKIIRNEKFTLLDKAFSKEELLNSLFIDYQPICICGPCCKLYKKEILEKNNITFNMDMTMGEDTWYNLDYLNVCDGKIVTLSKIYYNYMRENVNSLYTKYYDDYIIQTERVYNKFLILLKKYANNDTIDRFKKMYITNLVYANSINFKYDINYKKRIDDIKYSLNNKVVRANISKIKFNGIKEKVFKILIKLKWYHILYIYFNVKMRKER